MFKIIDEETVRTYEVEIEDQKLSEIKKEMIEECSSITHAEKITPKFNLFEMDTMKNITELKTVSDLKVCVECDIYTRPELSYVVAGLCRGDEIFIKSLYDTKDPAPESPVDLEEAKEKLTEIYQKQRIETEDPWFAFLKSKNLTLPFGFEVLLYYKLQKVPPRIESSSLSDWLNYQLEFIKLKNQEIENTTPPRKSSQLYLPQIEACLSFTPKENYSVHSVSETLRLMADDFYERSDIEAYANSFYSPKEVVQLVKRRTVTKQK